MRCFALHRWAGRTILRSYSTSVREFQTHEHGITLRPYQEACLDACLDALKAGSTRIGVSLPTGAGKTTVFISLLGRIDPPKEKPDADRALVIVNSVELALQAAGQAEKLFPEWTIEIEQSTKHRATGEADLTVATYQTLLQNNRIDKFDASKLKAVIVDEAHHAAAPSYLRILSHFHPDIQHPTSALPKEVAHPVPIFGFSATFSRHDGLALGSVFERIVYHRDFLEMIKEQWLCNVRFTCVRANLNLSEVVIQRKTGDFNPTSLAHVINTPTVNSLVVQTWLDRAATRKSTLVFCVNLAHLRDLTQAFRDAGVDARYVYSGTPAVERKNLITSFRAGEFPVLLNCAVLTEGADIPNIDCLVVARPTRSRNLFAQMIGRGMRLSPGTGKEDCRVIDFVDSANRVAGVISTPTLFGLDPLEIIDDETTDSLEERSNAVANMDDIPVKSGSIHGDIPDPNAVTYVDYDNPFAFVEQACGAPHIMQISQYAWVGCGDDVYVLECLRKGYIRIERIPGASDGEPQFRGHHTPLSMPSVASAMTLKISPWQRNKVILEANTLVEAVRGCETYVMAMMEGAHVGLLRSAKWRQEPATDGQKKVLQLRWHNRSALLKESSTQSTNILKPLRTLTKGEAANIIVRLRHGAQTRYEKKLKNLQKTARSLEKERKRMARTDVKVGPLPQVV